MSSQSENNNPTTKAGRRGNPLLMAVIIIGIMMSLAYALTSPRGSSCPSCVSPGGIGISAETSK